MKKTYLSPEIWVEELKMGGLLLGKSTEVTRTAGSAGFGYKGGGHGGARSGESCLWDEEEEEEDWDHL